MINIKSTNTIILETVSRPGIPNVNGLIYSKEAIDKAIKEFNESDMPLYLTERQYPVEKNQYDITSIDPRIILGEIKKISYESIEVLPNPDKLEKIKEYSDNGYKPGMFYSCELNNNQATNIKIISFDMLSDYEKKNKDLERKR